MAENFFAQFHRPEPAEGENYFARFGRASEPAPPEDRYSPDALAKQSRGRTWGEAASDLGVSAASGAGALVEGIGTLGGLISGNMDNPVRAAGKSAQEFWDARKSQGLKLREQDVAAKKAAADGELEKAWITVRETISDPALLGSFAASQAAQLVPGAIAGRAAGALGAAAGLGAKAAGGLATGAVVGTSGALQGADVASNAYDNANQVPQDLWNASPDYQSLVKQGATDAEAKLAISLEIARAAGAQGGVISLLTNSLPGARVLERVLAGSAKAGAGGLKEAVKAGLKGAAGEGLGEAIEEGGGQAAANVQVQRVNPDLPTTQGVGEAAGLGLIGGMAFGGPAGAIEAGTRRPEPKADPQAEVALNRAKGMGELAAAQDVDQAIAGFQKATQPTPDVPPVEFDRLGALGALNAESALPPATEGPQHPLGDANAIPYDYSIRQNRFAALPSPDMETGSGTFVNDTDPELTRPERFGDREARINAQQAAREEAADGPGVRDIVQTPEGPQRRRRVTLDEQGNILEAEDGDRQFLATVRRDARPHAAAAIEAHGINPSLTEAVLAAPDVGPRAEGIIFKAIIDGTTDSPEARAVIGRLPGRTDADRQGAEPGNPAAPDQRQAVPAGTGAGADTRGDQREEGVISPPGEIPVGNLQNTTPTKGPGPFMLRGKWPHDMKPGVLALVAKNSKSFIERAIAKAELDRRNPTRQADKAAHESRKALWRLIVGAGGISEKEAADINIDPKSLPGYRLSGLVTPNGMRADILARTLAEAGYLTPQQMEDGGDEAGRQVVADLLAREFVGRPDEVVQIRSLFEAAKPEVDALPTVDREDVADYDDSVIQPAAEEFDAALDAEPNMTTAEAMQTLGFTEEEIRDAERSVPPQRGSVARETGQDESGRPEGGGTVDAEQAQRGEGEARSEGGDQESEAAVVAAGEKADAKTVRDEPARQVGAGAGGVRPAAVAESNAQGRARAVEGESAVEASPPAAKPEPPKAAGKIEDVGEKIGGARKDLATSKGTRSTGPKPAEGAEPTWRKRFSVGQVVSSTKEGEVGKWSVTDTKATDWMGNPRQLGTFATQKEAEAMLPVYAVALKHSVQPASVAKGEPQAWEIVRQVGDRKRVKVVEQNFASREDALRYMATNAVQNLETKTSFGEEILPRPDKVKREGAKRRNGDVKGEDFRDTFGFRGVEFGNWNAQDERQTVMNHAYDALMDLAEVLGIPPKAIGLNGELALAFGARGHGLTGARAHYELDYGVMNLTKMKGAGSLAHEWFHALDHYFGRQDTKASSERMKNERGDTVFKTSSATENDMVSHGFSRQSKVREAVRQAYDAVIQTMFKKAETYVEDTAKADRFVAETREDLRVRLDAIRKDLAETKDPKYWKRNGKPASAEQLAEVDAIAESLLAGEFLDTEWRLIERDPKAKTRNRMASSRWTNDTLERLSALYKAVRGRSGFDSQGNDGLMDRLRYSMQRYSQRLKMLADAQEGTEKSRQVPTEYAMEAKSIDQGRASDYWTTPHEMAARAFQAYVEDKIAAMGARSDFLSYGTNMVVPTPWGWKRPYPKGAEREAINKAFDKLFDTIEVRQGEDGNMPMASRPEIRRSTLVDGYMQSSLPQMGAAHVGNTPAVLKALGAESDVLAIPESVLTDKALNAHGITPDMLRGLADELENPVMVFDSDTQPGSLVILTNLRNVEGKPVVVAVNPAWNVGGQKRRVVVNKVSTITQKDRPQVVAGWVEKGLLRYEDKKLGPAWSEAFGVQFPKTRTSSQSQGKRVLTDADVVKAGPMSARTDFTPPYDRLGDYRFEPRTDKAGMPGFLSPRIALARAREKDALGVPKGGRALAFDIFDRTTPAADGKASKVGKVLVHMDAQGRFVSLRNIEIDAAHQGQGLGEGVILGMLQHNGTTPMEVFNIQSAAKGDEDDALPFWRRIGTDILNLSTDPDIDIMGRISLAGYLKAAEKRSTLRGYGTDQSGTDRGEPPAARRDEARAGESDAGRTGRGPGVSGRERRSVEGVRAALESAFGLEGVEALEREGILHISTWAGAPQALTDALRSGDHGAYWPGRGAWIFADNIDPADAPRILLHEIGEHYGLKAMLGDTAYAKLIAQVKTLHKAGDKGIRAAWDHVKRNYADPEGSERFMHEVIAKAGEDSRVQSSKWWQRLLDAVRAWALKHGLAKVTGAEDLNILLHASLKAAMKSAGRAAPVTAEGVAAARAYHGTPHNVDRFSTDKIGTGEGAQAFGWGLYFAENERVADGYRKQLTGDEGLVEDIDGAVAAIDEALGGTGWEASFVETDASYVLRKPNGNEVRPDEAPKRIRKAADEALAPFINRGAVYTVDIPDEVVGRMLLWDKPLSEQPENVRIALEASDLFAKTEPWTRPDHAWSWMYADTGKGIYSRLSTELGSDRAASEYLDSIGIPGIKYLDQGSRSDGDGTYNLVVFNDKNIEITHKDGTPVTKAEREEALGEAMAARDSAPMASRPDLASAWQDLTSTATAKGARDTFLGLIENPNKFNLWDKTIGTQLNKAKKNTHFRKVFDALQAQQDDTAAFAIEAEAEAVDVLARMQDAGEIKRAVKSSLTGERREDLRAVSKAIFSNIEGKEGVKQKVFTDAELRQDFGLNDRQVAMYRQTREAIDQSLDRYAQSLAVKMGQKFVVTRDLARMTLADTVEALRERLEDRKRAMEDMRTAPTSELVRSLQTTPDGQTRQDYVRVTAGGENDAIDAEIEAIDAVLAKLPEIQNQAESLKAKGYAPAMRFGDYAVTAWSYDPRTGERTAEFFTMTETKTGANLLKMRLAKEMPGREIEVSPVDKESFKLFKGISPDTVELFARFMDVEEDAAFKEYIALAASSRSAMKRMLERKGVAGFSDDLPRVLAAFITSNARAAAQNLHGMAVNEAFEGIPQSQGDVRSEAAKLIDYVRNPTSDFAKVRGFMFAYFMGGSVSSALVNLTQPVMMTAPYLSQWAGTKTPAVMLRAAKMATSGTGDAGVKQALARADADGITDAHEYFALMQEAEGGGSVPTRAAMKAWGAMFGAAERFNRRVTFAAAYEVGQTMSEADLNALGARDAYEFAKLAVEETQGIYSRNNRANWARGPVGAVAMTFKQFSIAWLEFFTRLPKREKLLALAMLMLMAGLEGLPFAEDLEDLIDTLGQRMGYGTNSKRSLRLAATNLLGEAGAQFALHGISGISGVPMDVAGRLGMGNLVPGTKLLNPSVKDRANEVLDIAGPAGGVAQKAMGLAGGSVKEAFPKAFADAAKAIEMLRTGEYRDTKGRKVMDVDELDAAMKLLGFQPRDVAAATRSIGEQRRDVDTVRRVEAEIVEDWAEGVREKDVEKSRAARERLRQWNADNPDLPIRVKFSQVLKKVREANLTRDERFLKSAPPEMRRRLLTEAAL